MRSKQNRADRVYAAFDALSRTDKLAVLTRALQNKTLREDALDLATIASRANEPSQPLRDVLQEMHRVRKRPA